MKLLFSSLVLLQSSLLLSSAALSSLRGDSRNLVFSCPLTLEIECTVEDGKPCSNLEKAYTASEDAPTELLLRYHGGTCEQGYNSQSMETYHCIDHVADNAMNLTDEVWMFVSGEDDEESITYLEGPVSKGDDFAIEDSEGGAVLKPNITVAIYDSQAKPIQTFYFTPSRSLFLNDFFASTQLVQFKNAAQGLVSNFHDALLDFNIQNDASYGPVELVAIDVTVGHLVVAKQHGTFEDDNFLENGANTSISLDLQVDVGVNHEYTITADLHSTTCNVTNSSTVVIGDPSLIVMDKTTTAVETLVDPAPTPVASPVASPVATTTTTTASTCRLLSSITCEVISHPGVDCSSIPAPTELECLGGAAPNHISFVYTGQSCNDSDHTPSASHRFVCEDAESTDERRRLSTTQEVYISVNEEEPHAVTMDEEFTWTGLFGSYIHVMIYSSWDETTKTGVELLQNVKIGTRCQAGDDLTLHKHYGALQLLGFETASQGLVTSFADVEVTYILQDKGDATAQGLDVIAQYEMLDTTTEGNNNLISQTEKDLATDADLDSFVEYADTVRLDLLGSVDQVKVTLSAVADNGAGEECTEENEFFIEVVAE